MAIVDIHLVGLEQQSVGGTKLDVLLILHALALLRVPDLVEVSNKTKLLTSHL